MTRLAPWASRRLLRDGRQDLLHLREIAWLDQVVIEPRLLRTLPVALLSVSGHGDEHDVLESGLLTHPLRYLKTIESRQADVQQHHVRSVIEGRFQRPIGPS